MPGRISRCTWAKQVVLAFTLATSVSANADEPVWKDYVDNFIEVTYDLSYRAEPGRLSKWLRVRYDDGTSIDINIDDISAERASGSETSILLRQRHVGAGGRIFPGRMDSATTPRLWFARQAAIQVMEESNNQFIMAAAPAILFVISVAAAPLNPAHEGAVPAVTTRRAVPQTGGAWRVGGKVTEGGPKIGSAGGPGSGKRFSEAVKDTAEGQAGGNCVFCGKETIRSPGPAQRNTDHAIPKSRGGNNTLDNAQNTCRSCNLDKGTRTTDEYLRGGRR